MPLGLVGGQDARTPRHVRRVVHHLEPRRVSHPPVGKRPGVIRTLFALIGATLDGFVVGFTVALIAATTLRAVGRDHGVWPDRRHGGEPRHDPRGHRDPLRDPGRDHGARRAHREPPGPSGRCRSGTAAARHDPRAVPHPRSAAQDTPAHGCGGPARRPGRAAGPPGKLVVPDAVLPHTSGSEVSSGPAWASLAARRGGSRRRLACRAPRGSGWAWPSRSSWVSRGSRCSSTRAPTTTWSGPRRPSTVLSPQPISRIPGLSGRTRTRRSATAAGRIADRPSAGTSRCGRQRWMQAARSARSAGAATRRGAWRGASGRRPCR